MNLSTIRHSLLAPVVDSLRSAFRARCVLCGVAAPEGWCDPCCSSLAGAQAPRCPVCAEEVASGDTCGRCLRSPPAYSRVHAAASYAFPLDALIQRMKYAPDLSLVAPLAALLVQRVRWTPRPDVVIGMPLSAQRLRERGFNQANEIARRAARALRLQYAPDACRRERHGTPQAALPLEKRAANVKGAFSVGAEVDGRTVAVVDDVLTTGATLNEVALVMRRAGAREVIGWVLARTPPP
jgi:ComF family protein